MLKPWWGAPEGDLLSFAWQVLPPPLSSQPSKQEWIVYLHWFCPVKYSPNPQMTRSIWPILLFWGITEPSVLGDEMTKSGGLVRLLMSRSQHISLSRLESLEVTKGTIVPCYLSAFSAIERLPLPLSVRMQKKTKKKHFIVCQNRFFTTLFKW